MECLPLEALPGWAEDDHAAALLAYCESCEPDDPARAINPGESRSFLEQHFAAKLISAEGHLTGYYEPVLDASLTPNECFNVPLHQAPEGWVQGDLFASRAEIEAGALLAGRELAWLSDPLEAFLLQVQGSGRLRFADGGERRIGYAGKNGHPYVSIGKLLVAEGKVPAEEISIAAIRAYFEQDPEAGRALMRQNPSYVFFRWRDDLDPQKGPAGSMGVQLTAMRSLAIDPEHEALGGLIYIAPEGQGLSPQLCVAQDIGGAIKGRGRADLFCGTGAEAGALAGRINGAQRVWRLVPRGARA